MSINPLCGLQITFPLSLCSQSSTQQRDILTGLPYIQKLCTLTPDALSYKKEGGGITEWRQQWKTAPSSLLYVHANLEEFQDEMVQFTLFSQLVNCTCREIQQ